MALQTFRVRITEYRDIEAATLPEAMAAFHNELTEQLNSGYELDTYVTTVNENGEEKEEEV